MKFFRQTTALLAVGITAFLSLCEAPAEAFTITQNNNRNQLLNSLLGDTSGLSNFSMRLIGDGRAFGTFTDDPLSITWQKHLLVLTAQTLYTIWLALDQPATKPSWMATPNLLPLKDL